jgi:hypothetical protein
MRAAGIGYRVRQEQITTRLQLGKQRFIQSIQIVIRIWRLAISQIQGHKAKRRYAQAYAVRRKLRMQSNAIVESLGELDVLANHFAVTVAADRPHHEPDPECAKTARILQTEFVIVGTARPAARQAVVTGLETESIA